MNQYVGEWARFQDWCAAADRAALPASEDTVWAYLQEEQPSGGTAARWIAAIRTAHREAGLADPTGGQVKLWVRRARTGLPTSPAAIAEPLKEAAGRLPTTGWPAGLFGRRDRLAFLLYNRGPIPASTLVTMRATDVTVTAPATVDVTVDGTTRTVAEPPNDPQDPVVCVGCAALRWWWVLQHAAANKHRDMAVSISRAESRGDHVCADTGSLAAKLAPPAGWPLFPSIDRWGNLPSDPVPTMSIRGMETLLRDIGQQRWAHAAVPVPAPGAEKKLAHQEPVPAAAAEPLIPLSTGRGGVVARTRAKAALADISGQWDQVDAAIENLSDRVDELLADHASPK